MLKFIYLSDSLTSGEMKYQDPVPTRDVLQPLERAHVWTQNTADQTAENDW